jgi:hypothetical protein
MKVHNRSSAKIDHQFGGRAFQYDRRPVVHHNFGFCVDECEDHR